MPVIGTTDVLQDCHEVMGKVGLNGTLESPFTVLHPALLTFICVTCHLHVLLYENVMMCTSHAQCTCVPTGKFLISPDPITFHTEKLVHAGKKDLRLHDQWATRKKVPLFLAPIPGDGDTSQ